MLRRPRGLHGVDTSRESDTRPPRYFGPLRIHVAAREVFIDDHPIVLTRTEFDILEALSARPGVDLVGANFSNGPRRAMGRNDYLVDVHVGHLRRKLGDDAAQPRYIITIRGVGYRMGIGQ